jgi:hypothetical protein
MEQGRRVCYCECGNESSFFLKWDFLTTNYWHLQKSYGGCVKFVSK